MEAASVRRLTHVLSRFRYAAFVAGGLILVPGFLLGSSSADVFWQGYYRSQEGAYFALAREQGGAGTWRKLGQQFDQHQLVSFDREKEILVVEREGVQTALTLLEAGPARLTQAMDVERAKKPSITIVIGGHTSFTVVPELRGFIHLRTQLRSVGVLVPDAEVEISTRGEPPVAWMQTVTNACRDAGFKRITYRTVK